MATYPRTLAQAATTDLPSTYTRIVALDARDYGLAVSNTGAQNYSALNGLFNTTVRNLITAGTAVKVIIPPGRYLMSLGLYVQLTAATGGLHVSGYGATLVFDATPTGSWAMFKVRPLTGWTPGTPPANNTNYIHSIYIEGLGIEDPDTVGHVGAEETHGINVAYARNVHIWNCRVEGTGDEPLEVDYCEDFTIHDNYFYYCQNYAAKAVPDGANISIKNGCKRGDVYANTINTSIGGGSKGITVKIVEAAAVEDINIYSNSILNVLAGGLWISASGAAANRISFLDNTVDGCLTGTGNAGANLINDCTWSRNTFRNAVGSGAELNLPTNSVGNRFDQNRITNCGTAGTATTTYGAWFVQANAGGWASIHGNTFRDIQGRAIYLTGDGIKVSGGAIRNANLAATANQAAIHKSSGTGQIVEDIVITNPGQRGIQNIDYVRRCHITGNTGDAAVTGYLSINAGYYAGRLAGIQSGGSVVGADVDATGYTSGNALDVGTSTDCRIVGNKIRAYNAGGRKAWGESAGADRNLFANNIYFGATQVLGAASVAANNIAMVV